MRPLRTLAVLAALASAALLAPPAQAAATVRTSAATIYRGEGDQLLRVRTTTRPGIVKITHNGEGHLAVWTLAPSGREDDLLANQVGAYKGTSAFNTGTSNRTAAFSIKADGAWTLQVLPLTKARSWSITSRGTGDDVLRLSSTSRGLHRLRIRHSGDGHFAVWTLDANGRTHNLVVNKVGSYNGTVSLPPGTRYASIKANGTWSIVRR
ncbi:proprotein convertase P-domain-containing protein [Streptosporangium longisporum]|uniref:P/Homo B domain-containing protein n=1 Tax=Streptosporangium longisporum TaxID=46187 RepID=A0ABP6L6S2_9ACTN